MPRVTRRTFLDHTLSIAAAGAAAASRVGAEPPQPVEKTATRGSANDRIGIAIIGLHGRGLEHLDAYTFSDAVQIVALCDVDQSTFAKAEAKLQERGRPPARKYSDIRKLLEDKAVDAVSIATPNHWHALAGIWAMQAGKDVYVEKPVSHTFLEGRKLEQARQKHNRICQAGTQSRSNPAHRQAIQYIREGHIGKLLLARGLCYKPRKSIGHLEDSPTPPGVDYDLWLGPAPLRPFNANRFHYNWHWNWEYGNGDLGNQGVHQMDIARWALDKELPKSAIGFGGRFAYIDDGQTPNTQVGLCDYGDAQILFEVRGLTTSPVMELSVGTIVYGTDGFVAFANEDIGSAIAFNAKGEQVRRFHGGGNHFANFVSAVRSRKQSDLNCPILEGHLSSALCHLINISYQVGNPQPFSGARQPLGEKMDLHEAFGRFEQHLADNALRLREMTYQLGPSLSFDPQAENFGNCDKANRLLTREYRRPFVIS